MIRSTSASSASPSSQSADLGEQRIDNSNPNVLVTKASDGSLVVAVWNLVNPGSIGTPKTVKLQFKGVRSDARVVIRRVDEDHGNTLGLWQKMGSPRYPTQGQLDDLRQQSRTGPDNETLTDGGLTLQLPVNGLAVLQVR